MGIDEAGRGPVLGPLVLCGYMIEENDAKGLKGMGVKDSKQLTPQKREALVPLLKEKSSDYIIIKVSAGEVDSRKNLNHLEIHKMQGIINALQPDKVIIDSPERNTAKFSKKIMAGVEKKLQIVCENFADVNHPEVSAASIMAKSVREEEIAKLHKEYGYFGSGYTSDERTIAFLKDWIRKNKELPGMARKSWITSRMLMAEVQQARLW